jgi:serine/threonine-protein kinase
MDANFLVTLQGEDRNLVAVTWQSTVLLSGPANVEATWLRSSDKVELPTSWVGPYQILGVLGHGGQGLVYRVHDSVRQRTVALKYSLATDEPARQRFALEVELMSRLAHPAIVPLYDSGEDQGQPYFTMEWIDGTTLADHLDRHGPLVPDAAVALVLPLAQAVQHAHARQVVHRDLTPANILLDRKGRPYITDFGLARPVDGTAKVASEVGGVMGTPAYMSPEQAAGQAHLAGPAADIWGLGAILYTCLTGEPPFQGATARDVLHRVGRSTPVLLRKTSTGLPLPLKSICQRCLRKDPAHRYQTAGALIRVLEQYLHGYRAGITHADPVSPEPVWDSSPERTTSHKVAA